MTPLVVSSVRPVALLVHLVHRYAFPRPVGGLRRFCSLGGGGTGLLGGGGASIGYGLRRRHFKFCYCRQRAFRAWLWVLWHDRNGCSGPDVRVGTSQPGRRDFRSLQTTFPMNQHVCVIPWGSRRCGAG